MPGYYNILRRIGVPDLTEYTEYEAPTFTNEDKLFAALDDIRENNRRVLLPGDPDVDGLMSLLVQKDAFNAMGVNTYDFFDYENKSHAINPNCIWKAIQQRYDYVIISDAGSNSLKELNQLVSYGVKVIVLDHHKSNHDYNAYDENGIICINTQIENAILGEPRYALSAGSLCFCLYSKYLKSRKIKVPSSLEVYALISLFSDCMDMSNKLNRQIYYLAIGRRKEEMPASVQYFMTMHNTLSRRFVEYWFAPRVNALFRADAVKYINYFFLEKTPRADVISACLVAIESIYTTCRDVISSVADLLANEQQNNWENIAVIDLGSINSYYDVEKNRLYNYTGLIANKLSERWGKPVVVCCEMTDGYKGSVRDLRGRDYLSLFKNICSADGHSAAFGWHVPKFDYQRFLTSLHHVDKHYAIGGASNAPIVIEYTEDLPDMQLLYEIAKYNDFCGEKVPYIYLSKKVCGSISSIYCTYEFQYRWGTDVVISSKRNILLGETVYVKPYLSNRLKLEVQ